MKKIPYKTPKYEQIRLLLRREISSGYRVGDLFPTQRELMKRFNASYATIGRVLRELKAENIIHTHVGRGIFIDNLPAVRSFKPVKIAVFISHEPAASDLNIFGLFQKGLLNAQEKYSCEINFFEITDNIEAMTACVRKNNADGVLFLEDKMLSFIESVKKTGIPYTVVHPYLTKHDFCVDIDDAVGIYAAIQAMACRGAKRIALVGSDLGSGHNKIKADAFCTGLTIAGLEFDSSLVCEFHKHDDMIARMEKLRSFFLSPGRADGLFLIGLEHLEMTESLLKHENIRIPEDMLITVFGHFGYAQKAGFPLGTIIVPYEEAAEKGAEMLVNNCNSKKKETDIKLLKTTFIWRGKK
ncbi:MAG TPA: hypothetical protein DC049_10730 [Spirochaetia bacterium]|nr:hypothetical protein [Spirochaetia bacterium]